MGKLGDPGYGTGILPVKRRPDTGSKPVPPPLSRHGPPRLREMLLNGEFTGVYAMRRCRSCAVSAKHIPKKIGKILLQSPCWVCFNPGNTLDCVPSSKHDRWVRRLRRRVRPVRPGIWTWPCVSGLIGRGNRSRGFSRKRRHDASSLETAARENRIRLSREWPSP